MFRQLVIFALFAVASLSAKVERFYDIPEEYRALSESTDFGRRSKSLTNEDVSVWKELTNDPSKFTTQEELMTILKLKSPSLYEKLSKSSVEFSARVDALGEEANTFFVNVFEEGRQLYREYLTEQMPSLPEINEMVKTQLTAYEALSAESKEQLMTQFPELASVYDRRKIQSLIQTTLIN